MEQTTYNFAKGFRWCKQQINQKRELIPYQLHSGVRNGHLPQQPFITEIVTGNINFGETSCGDFPAAGFLLTTDSP